MTQRSRLRKKGRSAMEFIIEDGILKKCVGDEEDIRVPEGVTAIAEEAFYDLNVQSVQLPESLRTIECSAFNSCYHLTDVEVPHADEIRYYAFYICPKLKCITLPDSLVSLSEAMIKYVPKGLIIKGKRGTLAEDYARAHGLVLIDAETGQEIPDTDTEVTEDPEQGVLKNCYLRKIHHFECSARTDSGIDADDIRKYYYRIPMERKIMDGDNIIGISYMDHEYLFGDTSSRQLRVVLKEGFVGGWGDVTETETYDLILGRPLVPEEKLLDLPGAVC